MNKRIEEKAKDDRMSNHATFIAAKRQEIASLRAKIETKLTWQGEPAVEAESMRNECKDAERSRAEAKEQRERSGSRGTPSHSRNNVPHWRVSPHRQWTSSCRQCSETVSVLWFASSICGGQHSNSYIQIGDEMVCSLNAELDGDDSKKLCSIKSFDEISAEKMIRSD